MCLALPGKLISAEDIGENRLGIVRFAAGQRQVFLDFVPEAKTGDYILVHAGFAISLLNEEEAREASELLEQIGMLEAGNQDTLPDTSDSYNGPGVGSQSLRFCGGWPVRAMP